jgi:hypothetical protein
MPDRGFSSLVVRALLAFCMTIALTAIPACSDPEVGSMPKMKKSKADTLKEVDGPERATKKKSRAR